MQRRHPLILRRFEDPNDRFNRLHAAAYALAAEKGRAQLEAGRKRAEQRAKKHAKAAEKRAKKRARAAEQKRQDWINTIRIILKQIISRDDQTMARVIEALAPVYAAKNKDDIRKSLEKAEKRQYEVNGDLAAHWFVRLEYYSLMAASYGGVCIKDFQMLVGEMWPPSPEASHAP